MYQVLRWRFCKHFYDFLTIWFSKKVKFTSFFVFLYCIIFISKSFHFSSFVPEGSIDVGRTEVSLRSGWYLLSLLLLENLAAGSVEIEAFSPFLLLEKEEKRIEEGIPFLSLTLEKPCVFGNNFCYKPTATYAPSRSFSLSLARVQ